MIPREPLSLLVWLIVFLVCVLVLLAVLRALGLAV